MSAPRPGRGAPLAALGALLAACAPAAPGPATLRFALEAERCADFCAETVRATVYRDGDPFPLGPPAVVACGADITFDDLPAGHRLAVEVELLDLTGAPLLRGRSAVVTIAADATVDAPVSLAALAPPRLDAVSPDPVVPDPAGPVPLTLSGADFGDPGGAFGVELDGQPLDASAWGDDEIVAQLGPSARGADLAVRRCGVASAPLPVRVVPTAPALAPLAQPPGCAGRRYTALTADGASVLAAVACDDAASGHLQRLVPDAACPFALAEAWPLGDAPIDLSAAHGRAWVALAGGGLVLVPLGGPEGGAPRTVTLATDTAAVAVEATAGGDGQVYAIGRGPAGTALFGGPGAEGPGAPVPGVDAALELADLASDATRLYAVGRAAGGVGKLVGVPVAGGTVSEWSLEGCSHPTHVATGGRGWVAIACAEDGGARVVGFDPANLAQVSDLWAGADAPLGLALDGVGDAALVLGADGARLVAFAAEGARALVTWPALGGGPAARLGASHELAVVTPDGLGVGRVGLYREGDPCDAP